MIEYDERPLNGPNEDEPRMTDHCYDGEKCNADTFCDCPCRTCVRTKRGEFQTR